MCSLEAGAVVGVFEARLKSGDTPSRELGANIGFSRERNGLWGTFSYEILRNGPKFTATFESLRGIRTQASLRGQRMASASRTNDRFAPHFGRSNPSL